jgi:hypothetical protein
MIAMSKQLIQDRLDEEGFTTAELLGNAALGVLALVVIWNLISGDDGLAQHVIKFIQDQLVK